MTKLIGFWIPHAITMSWIVSREYFVSPAKLVRGILLLVKEECVNIHSCECIVEQEIDRTSGIDHYS